MADKKQNTVVYFHRDSETNQVFYVGIGYENRAYCYHNRNKYWKNYVRKYGNPIIEIVHSGLSVEDAKQLEKKYIRDFGRKTFDKNGILVNLSIGGESALGVKRSAETKLMTSVRHKGKVLSDETKRKISESVRRWIDKNGCPNIGLKRTDEAKRKISEANKGRLSGSNHPLFGKHRSEETKQKLREANLGKRRIA